MKDTLEHSLCGCAVGNLICHYKGIKNKQAWNTNWNYVFLTTASSGSQFDIKEYYGEARDEIDCTGYSPYELAEVEKAFETGDKNRTSVFLGLMSVCDTLMQIHEATTDEIQEAKLQFVKP